MFPSFLNEYFNNKFIIVIICAITLFLYAFESQGDWSIYKSAAVIDKYKNQLESSIYQQLFEIGKHLIAESTVDKLLSVALDKSIEISNAERGMIILFGKDEKILFQAARNLNHEDIEHPKFEISRTIINNVKKDKHPIYLHNALEDSSYKKSSEVTGIRNFSILCSLFIFYY